jgi:hypothetical protein
VPTTVLPPRRRRRQAGKMTRGLPAFVSLIVSPFRKNRFSPPSLARGQAKKARAIAWSRIFRRRRRSPTRCRYVFWSKPPLPYAILYHDRRAEKPTNERRAFRRHDTARLCRPPGGCGPCRNDNDPLGRGSGTGSGRSRRRDQDRGRNLRRRIRSPEEPVPIRAC